MNRKQRRSGSAANSGAPDPFNQALLHHQAGRLDQAAEIYRQLLRQRPDAPPVLKHLGLVHLARSEWPAAIAVFDRLTSLVPADGEASLLLGVALANSGALDRAVEAYRRSLRHREHPETRMNLANALAQLGRIGEAEEAYRHVLGQLPGFAPAHANFGHLLRDAGRHAEAIEHYDRALGLAPRDIAARVGKALSMARLERGAEALEELARAERLEPTAATVANARGIVFKGLGRHEESLAAFQRALTAQPGFAEAWTNAGCALFTLGRPFDAIRHHQDALRLNPAYADAHINLGLALNQVGDTETALAAFAAARSFAPDNPEALFNLGIAQAESGRLAEATATLGHALEKRPGYPEAEVGLWNARRKACDWEGLDDLERALLERSRNGWAHLAPFNLLSMASTPEEQLRAAQLWSALLPRAELVEPLPAPPHSRPRIGYLSADFREHAVAHLFTELFEIHDRDRFDIVGYSYGPDDGSAMRRRLATAFDCFVDLRSLSHAEAAARIRADGIDILVDLTGHTDLARLEIAALRPAPIQATWLGYPGTLGADFIDYAIVDPVIVPAAEQQFFSERLVHLPDCYQANDRRREVAERTPTRAECGLPETGTVFCCFNNSYKLTPAVFEVWMDLLQRLPASVLWLLGSGAVVENLRRAAERHGIDPNRLIFAPKLPLAEHLARQRQADLFLDTLPYNAHTTASDALWVGLPVLTRAGNTFAGRVAASLLKAIGVEELITHSLEEYRALALHLAENPAILKDLRNRIIANRDSAPLFDTPRFARNIETAYTRMWEIHQAGEAPRPIVV